MKLLKFLHRWIGFPVGIIFLAIIATGVVNGSKDLFYKFGDFGQTYQKTTLEQDAAAITFMAEQHADASGFYLATPERPFYQAKTRDKSYSYSIGKLDLVAEQHIDNTFFSTNLNFHKSLLLGKQPVFYGLNGPELVAWMALFSAALALVGLLLWFPIFRSFRFKGAWPKNTQRSSLQKAHINAGVIVLLPVLLLTLTGAGIAYRQVTTSLLDADRNELDFLLEEPVVVADDWLSWMQVATAALPDGQLESITLPRKKRGMGPGGQQGKGLGSQQQVTQGSEGENAAERRMPEQKEGAGNRSLNLRETVQFNFKTEQDWLGLAASKAYFDKAGSSMLGADYFRDKHLGAKLYTMMIPLHTGQGLTRPYLFFVLLPMAFSVCMVFFGVCGFWKKRDKFGKLARYVSTMGAFVGLSSSRKSANKPLADTELQVLYASQTGNGQAVAERVFESFKKAGLPVSLHNLANYRVEDLSSQKHVALIVSTQGNGDVPDDAEDLLKYLSSTTDTAVSPLNDLFYSVFALGDSNYSSFCAAGKTFDNILMEKGASNLLSRMDCDVDYQAHVGTWAADLLSALKVSGDFQQIGIADDLLVTAALPTETIVKATLQENYKLSGEGSNKEVRHIELEFGDSALKYQPGDLLGLYFTNDSVLVDEIIGLCGLSREAAFQPLSEQYELTLLHPGFVERYAALSGSNELQQLAADPEGVRAYISGRQVVDVIRSFPASLSLEQLLSCLRRITPRKYSIASAQIVTPQRVALTVAVVRYLVDGQLRSGGATGYLADRVTLGDRLPVVVEENRHFKLPDDNNADIIMIAAGTGVAPYRGFLQQRFADRSLGRNWLFFGDQTMQSDYLYEQEWQSLCDSGVLTVLDTAFSRDQPEKVYVQHKMQQKAQAFFEWLEAGAYIYVCGDAKKMARDVDVAILTILQQQGGFSEVQAEDYLNDLRKKKRYQRDVY